MAFSPVDLAATVAQPYTTSASVGAILRGDYTESH